MLPLVTRSFEAANKDFEKILKILARLTASGEDGISISLLYNLDRKGGVCVIMNHPFR